MSWFTSVFGTKQSWEDEWAKNIYEALVEKGGPGADAFDAMELKIKIGDLEKFSKKERLRLEILCLVCLSTVAVKAGGKFSKVPFAFGRLLNEKWRERGIYLPNDEYDIAEKCFDDYEKFLEKPIKWCGEWLSEFYETDDEVNSHRILFTDHCLKQAKAVQMTVEGFVS